MRFAFISDIHGNHEALSAVLADIGQKSIDKVFCLGDVVGYGAEPGRCIEEIRGVTDWIVAGNHDHGAIGRLNLNYFNHNARLAAQWTAAALTPAERTQLGLLPLHRTWVHPTGDFITVHSTPDKPDDWHYVLSVDEAEFQFECFKEPLCFIGHSHLPIFWQYEPSGKCLIVGREYLHCEPDKRYLVNIGSVGQPRDGDPRASYAIYDLERQEIVIRRVEYDIKAAQQKILRAGLPARLAERLAYGM